jgi:penicillin-binding protein 1B
LPIKLRVPKNSLIARLHHTFAGTKWRRIFWTSTAVLLLVGFGIFLHFYNVYAKMIQAKLEAGPFADMSVLYAAPRPITTGEKIEPAEIAAYLRHAGYSEDSNRSPVGWYHLRPDAIEINPGPEAFDGEGAVIKVSKGAVSEIISQHDDRRRTQFMLEPEPMSNLFDKQRQKRRIVRYEDIPKVMVDAAISAEDKNFFLHPGFDAFGIMRAAYRDLTGDRLEGASTITQQLATTLWLGDAKRDVRRKVAQTLITMHLEQRLTKQQIFEYYANSIDVGHQGSFWVRGFAQGALVYFGKDLREITVPEAAMLAGLPQGPAIYDPFRHPDKALARRNLVLKAMRENGKITEPQLQEAIAAPLGVKPEAAEGSDAPYFVDLVTQNLEQLFPERDFRGSAHKIYTTLDLDLQRDLVEAGRKQITVTDEQWKKRNKEYGTPKFPRAQYAAIVLDAETGDLLALQGGRNYAESQFDRALAKRQPGSSFKPIVYAAAMASALDASSANVITPATTVMDEATTFYYDNGEKTYEPHDHDKFKGLVTLRYALAHSLNVPAVKIAENVGYDKVVKTARAFGMNEAIKPTPSIALGTYEVTPLEIAGAYTVFVNDGKLVKTSMIKSIRASNGDRIFQSKVEKKDAIDPRVAYLVQSMMQEVLRSGTGAGVSRYGFNLPAAGKTGTSFDGWFVGFTSRIVCAVWVGFDDNRDFELEGARSALPIWADFMTRAHKHREYANVHVLPAPDGVVATDIDAETGELATPACPRVRSEVFIAGTQPVQLCHLHGKGGQTLISSWETEPVTVAQASIGSADPVDPPARVARSRASSGPPKVIAIVPGEKKKESPKEPPKGFVGWVKGLFK